MAFHQNNLFAADFLEYPQQHCGYYKYLSVMIQRYCPLTNQFELLYVFDFLRMLWEGEPL